MEFDWDDGNRNKCAKHGLTPAEIEAFFRLRPRVALDVRHSVKEQRFAAIGRDKTGRAIFAAFCWRGKKIRPVSVRYMHEREVRKYEKSTDNDN